MYKKIIGLTLLALLFSGSAAFAQIYDSGTPSGNTNQTNQNTTDNNLNANVNNDNEPGLPDTGAGGDALIIMASVLAAAALAGSAYMTRKATT